jgi:hypothetical protein
LRSLPYQVGVSGRDTFREHFWSDWQAAHWSKAPIRAKVAPEDNRVNINFDLWWPFGSSSRNIANLLCAQLEHMTFA